MNNFKIIELSTAYRPPALYNIYPFLVGYSLRRLNNSIGKCMQIQRDSDLATTDIFFAPNGAKITKNSLTSSGETLEAWANGSICRVSVWYNQGYGGSIYDAKKEDVNTPKIYDGANISIGVFKTGVHFEFGHLVSDFAPSLTESSLYFLAVNLGANSDYRRAFSVVDPVAGQNLGAQVNVYMNMAVAGSPLVEKIGAGGSYDSRLRADPNVLSSALHWVNITNTQASLTKIETDFITAGEVVVYGSNSNYWFDDIPNSKILLGNAKGVWEDRGHVWSAGLLIPEIILYDTPLTGQIKIDVEANLNTQ